VGERRQPALDRFDVDQAGIDGQRLVGVLAIEAEADGASAPQLALKPGRKADAARPIRGKTAAFTTAASRAAFPAP